jgi:hypothetical protein
MHEFVFHKPSLHHLKSNDEILQTGSIILPCEHAVTALIQKFENMGIGMGERNAPVKPMQKH